MMKKTICLLVILSLLVSVFAPVTAYASTSARTKTVEQRIADIKETYGIPVVIASGKDLVGRYDYLSQGIFLEYTFTKADVALAVKALGNLEKALEMLGSQYTKKLVKEYAKKESFVTYNDTNLKGLYIIIRGYSGYNQAQGFMLGEGRIDIWTGDLVAPVNLFLHELGHALHFIVHDDGNAPGNFAKQKYPGQRIGDPTAQGFITSYSAVDWMEDYAETFAYMVENNTNNLMRTKTAMWNKGKTVYDDLVAFYGTGSRTTQRVASNLGIEIKKK